MSCEIVRRRNGSLFCTECPETFPKKCDAHCDSGDPVNHEFANCQYARICPCWNPATLVRLRLYRQWWERRGHEIDAYEQHDIPVRYRRQEIAEQDKLTICRTVICPSCGGPKNVLAKNCNSCHNKIRHGIEIVRTDSTGKDP